MLGRPKKIVHLSPQQQFERILNSIISFYCFPIPNASFVYSYSMIYNKEFFKLLNSLKSTIVQFLIAIDCYPRLFVCCVYPKDEMLSPRLQLDTFYSTKDKVFSSPADFVKAVVKRTNYDKISQISVQLYSISNLSEFNTIFRDFHIFMCSNQIPYELTDFFGRKYRINIDDVPCLNNPDLFKSYCSLTSNSSLFYCTHFAPFHNFKYTMPLAPGLRLSENTIPNFFLMDFESYKFNYIIANFRLPENNCDIPECIFDFMDKKFRQIPNLEICFSHWSIDNVFVVILGFSTNFAPTVSFLKSLAISDSLLNCNTVDCIKDFVRLNMCYIGTGKLTTYNRYFFGIYNSFNYCLFLKFFCSIEPRIVGLDVISDYSRVVLDEMGSDALYMTQDKLCFFIYAVLLNDPDFLFLLRKFNSDIKYFEKPVLECVYYIWVFMPAREFCITFKGPVYGPPVCGLSEDEALELRVAKYLKGSKHIPSFLNFIAHRAQTDHSRDIIRMKIRVVFRKPQSKFKTKFKSRYTLWLKYRLMANSLRLSLLLYDLCADVISSAYTCLNRGERPNIYFSELARCLNFHFCKLISCLSSKNRGVYISHVFSLEVCILALKANILFPNYLKREIGGIVLTFRKLSRKKHPIAVLFNDFVTTYCGDLEYRMALINYLSYSDAFVRQIL